MADIIEWKGKEAARTMAGSNLCKKIWVKGAFPSRKISTTNWAVKKSGAGPKGGLSGDRIGRDLLVQSL